MHCTYIYIYAEPFCLGLCKAAEMAWIKAYLRMFDKIKSPVVSNNWLLAPLARTFFD